MVTVLEITSHQMPGIDERQAALYVACQEDAVAKIEHAPQLVIGQTLDLLLTEMSKLARGGIQLFHTRPIGRNPEFAILRFVILVISLVAMLAASLASCL